MRQDDRIQKITAHGLFPASLLCGIDEGEPPDEAQVQVCRQWLRLHASPAVRITTKRGSYGLKHDVENWTTRVTGDAWRVYVTNGAFIEAAKREGYRMKRTHRGSPNAYFNMHVNRTACPATSEEALIQAFEAAGCSREEARRIAKDVRNGPL